MTNEGHTAPRRTPTHGPAYLRIADDLRIDIEKGVLSPGEALPSLAAISGSYKVSQAVARQAIALLATQGLIVTGQGKRPTVRAPRTRVTRSNQQHHEEKRRVTWSEEERRKNGPLEDTTGISLEKAALSVEYTQVQADASVPEYPAGTRLLRREYETLSPEKRRIAWSVSWIPVEYLEPNPALLDSGNEPWPGSTQHQLHTVGVEVAEVVDMITARAPSTVEAEQWDMAPGEPLIVGRDRMTDTEGRVVSVSLSQYPADSTQLEFVTPLERQP